MGSSVATVGVMASEERLSGFYGEIEEQNERIECAASNVPDASVTGRVNMFLFQGRSVYDAWFSAASSQVRNLSLSIAIAANKLGFQV